MLWETIRTSQVDNDHIGLIKDHWLYDVEGFDSDGNPWVMTGRGPMRLRPREWEFVPDSDPSVPVNENPF